MAKLTTVRQVELGELVVRELRATGAVNVPPHEHRAPHLTLVTAGMISDRADGSTALLKAGDALFRPAGVHENTIPASGSHSIVVELTPKFLAAFGKQNGLRSRPLHVAGETLRDLPQRALEELKKSDPLTPVVFAALIQQILALGLRANGNGNAEPAPAWLERAMRFIENEYKRPITMREAAAAAGVSALRLRSGLRRWYGRSFSTVLRERRIAAALVLLETRAPLSEIALACGFYDQPHFTRSFRATHGVSPQRYRARNA
jgi:AraC family transcriptional regulator